MIVVKVRDRDIKAAPMGPVTTGSVGLPVRWEFSEEWTGLAKTAVFRGSNTARDVFLTSDECTVPAEVLTAGDGPLEIGVRGVQITHDEDTDEDVLTVVIPTIWGRIERIFDGTIPSQVDPSVQEPDWTDQVKAAAAEALSMAAAAAPFYAEFGVTTKAEIEAAINNNRQIYAYQSLSPYPPILPYVGKIHYDDEPGSGTGYRFSGIDGTTQTIYELMSTWVYRTNDLTEPAQRAEAAQAAAEAVLESIPSDYTELSDAVNGSIVDIDPGTLTSGYMDTATGIKRSSSSGLGVTDYIDIGDYEKIAFRRIRSTSATAATGTCFYRTTEASSYIGGIVSLRSQPTAGYDTQLTIADIPNGAHYVRFTGYIDTSTYGDFTVKGIKASIPNDISNVARAPQIGNIFCVSSTLPNIPTSADVFAAYDELVANYPLIMSKSTLTSGSFNNYELVFSTGNYNTNGRRTRDAVIAKPKILITSGTHGAERSAVMSLYYFVKAMCENAYTLNDVINPVEYRIIPIVCPWGYDNNSRTNENGVNINRNFATSDWTQTATGDDYSGASAGDQLETQVVQNWLTANNDAEIFIDFHNSGYSEEISALLGLSTQAHMAAKMCYLQSVNKIVPYLKNARNLGQGNVFAYTGNTDIPGTAKGYGEEHGIMSFTLETSNNVENHGKYGAFVNAIGCEMFGATIKGLVKYVLLKDPINAAILG